MNPNNFKQIEKVVSKNRRGVAEVISTLLLVVITVAGAVILTSFLDETFVAGSVAVTSGKDVTIKTIKLIAYDTRDGEDLMGNPTIDNNLDQILCSAVCSTSTNDIPSNGGSEFLVIQIENLAVNPIYIKSIYLGKSNHLWDSATVGVQLDATGPLSGGAYPEDGKFSVLPADMSGTVNQLDNQVIGGQTVNLLVKLHSDQPSIYPDLELSKSTRVQINIGSNSLAEFLIETGDTR